MPVTVKGSGGGGVTLDSGSASANSTLTLPNTTGTVALTASPTFSGAVTATTVTSPSATALTIQSAGTTAMTVDTSQNVGIGTTSPGAKLNAYNNSAVVTELRAGNSVSYASILVDATGASQLYAPGGTQIFSVGGSERMRLDSSGNLLVGTTTLTDGSRLVIRPATNQAGLTVQQNGAGDYCIHLNAVNNGGAFYYQYFLAGATNVGSISSNTTTTSYNTSSDHRLKENVASMTIGLATIAALRPVTYDWKIDGSSGEGFIAHELQAVIPLAVSGEKDAVNEDGSIKSQGVDYSKVVVHLVAAIQELSAKNDALEARLAALEAK